MGNPVKSGLQKNKESRNLFVISHLCVSSKKVIAVYKQQKCHK